MLGRSGSGKSTLLRTLAGLDPAPAGTVTVPAERAVVFQEPRLVPWKRVWRNVALGLRADDARERALAALTEVGLGHRSDPWPLTLSGGEGQRAPAPPPQRSRDRRSPHPPAGRTGRRSPGG
jgi:sulfonate transport system ATP-binding protein